MKILKNNCLSLFIAGLLAVGAMNWTACSDDDGGGGNNNNNMDQDGGVDAGEDEFAEVTILSTSDMHSHAAGYATYLDYSPDDTSDNDAVQGGYARIATLVNQIRSDQDALGIPVLLFDSGDFTMGTLFDLSADNPVSFWFLQQMEYDAATLGNHEFDWGPDGAALLISNAMTNGFTVPILASNMVTDANDAGDNAIEALVTAGAIADSVVITLENGLVVGVLGLLGDDAEFSAAPAAPITWDHETTAIQAMVDRLRDTDNVDMVIVLSHGGIQPDGTGEDVDLGEDVTGIDVILSGHTHTETPDPVVTSNNTYVFEAGSYGRKLGRLDVNYNITQATVDTANYTLIDVDDTIAGNTTVTAYLDGVISGIDTLLMAGLGVVAATPVVELPFDMEIPYTGFEESPLGNLCADAYRNVATAAVLATGGATPDAIYQVGIVPDGVVRDGLLVGETGVASFMDVYNVLPLGASPDPTQTALGYPLHTAYLTPAELKVVGEVAVSVSFLANLSSAWLSFSGIRFDYDPAGAMLNRITGAWFCGNAIPAAYGGHEDYFSIGCTVPVDFQDNTTLIRVVADLYSILTFGGLASFGIVITPKHADGTPIDLTDMTDVLSTRIDADPATGGLQELKAWTALWQFLGTLPDGDSSGLPEIPAAIYNATNGAGMGRMNAQ